MGSAGSAGGRLACVGLGMMLGAHLTPRSREHIERADVVFVLASDAIVELWVQALRPDARSLQAYYGEHKPRRTTYAEMVDVIVEGVYAGHRVCAAFYGHPGVFAQVAHEAIARAREDGFAACMEPGISAEDCLYADLSIDPGRHGCQHHEATRFVRYRRTVDPSAYLVLWQVALLGETGGGAGLAPPARLQVLVDRLAEVYDLDHPIQVYEAATSPLATPRADTLRLRDLPGAALCAHSTLVVPPVGPPELDPRYAAALDGAQGPDPHPRPRLVLVKT